MILIWNIVNGSQESNNSNLKMKILAFDQKSTKPTTCRSQGTKEWNIRFRKVAIYDFKKKPENSHFLTFEFHSRCKNWKELKGCNQMPKLARGHGSEWISVLSRKGMDFMRSSFEYEIILLVLYLPFLAFWIRCLGWKPEMKRYPQFSSSFWSFS